MLPKREAIINKLKPIVVSVVATVIVNKENIKPTGFIKYTPKNIKFKPTEKNISSIQRIIIKKFRWFQIIPIKPMKNKKKEKFMQVIKGKTFVCVFIKEKIKNTI